MSEIRLRPHHLLCVLTYGGRGYTPAFVEGMNQLVDALSAGATVEVITGPDDICAPMMRCPDHPDFHCENPSVAARDALALEDLAPLLPGLGIGARVPFSAPLIAHLRAHFATRRIRRACSGCEWEPRCTHRAEIHFEGARLRVG